NRIAPVVAAAGPAPVRVLVLEQDLGAPAVPVLAADLRQAIEHGHAFDRPEIVGALHAGVVELFRGLADRRRDSLQATGELRIVEDDAACGVFVLHLRQFGGGRDAHGQAEQADAGHGRRRLLAGLIAPAAVEILRAAETPAGQLQGAFAGDV